jgi:leucyl/phenylalanyl-tRNA--protein transferase
MRKKIPAGPDPDFPFLSVDERFAFPEMPRGSKSVVCWGGNLSPGMLLSAYEQGIFPWYGEGEPVVWHSPDPRFVLFPEDMHVSQSMEKVLRRADFRVELNGDFPAVIAACAEVRREGQAGTWITADMIAAYTALFRAGFAVCAEAFADGELAGGCYGVKIGGAFFGESMFARKTNASKAAFITLARTLFQTGTHFIDCQAHSNHLQSLGARLIPRTEFLAELRGAVARKNAT